MHASHGSPDGERTPIRSVRFDNLIGEILTDKEIAKYARQGLYGEGEKEKQKVIDKNNRMRKRLVKACRKGELDKARDKKPVLSESEALRQLKQLFELLKKPE